MEISKEIKNAGGVGSVEDLLSIIPDNPDYPTGDKTEKATPFTASGKPRKPRVKKTPAPPVSADPFANDPRYQQACAEMAAFGGKGIIERGFDSGAHFLEDESFKLNDAEKRQWDNFFYVLSKKPIFDVGKPLFLALFFIVTLLAQLGWRVLERSDTPFIKELFSVKKEEDNAPNSASKPN